MECIESSEAFFCDDQCTPDQSGCRRDLLVAFCSVCSEADRCEGTLHDVGGSQVPPVFCRKVEEGEHAIPVSIKGLDCLGELVLISCDELLAELPGICNGVGIGDLNEQRQSLGLLAFVDLVEHVEYLVVPAPLLLGLWPDLIDRGPDAHIAVGDDESRGAQTVAGGPDDDQQARLILLSPALT